ncbi:hypothetical protein E5D57_009572 [Metarhizium anisopliae]|nr:hypothetical protein E5D57_009572 [Metarhizium anisopliae]
MFKEFLTPFYYTLLFTAQGSCHRVAHPARALTPGNLLDRSLATQVSRVDVRPPAGIDVGTDDAHNAELVLAGGQQAPIGNQPRQALSAKVVLGPKLNLDGHRPRQVFVDAPLDRRPPLSLYGALELAARAVGEVRRLELVEAGDFRLEQTAHGGAQDVAGRVEARVQEALFHVQDLRHLVAGLDLGRCGGRWKRAEVQHLRAVDGVDADGLDVEGRGVVWRCVGCRGAVGAPGDETLVGGLSAALRVKYGLAGYHDKVVVGAILEEKSIGIL